MELFLQPIFAMPEEAFAPGYRTGGPMPADWREAPVIDLEGDF